MAPVSTFSDLAPTETDAAGVVGGAFLDLTPVITALGVVVSGLVHID